MEYTKSMTKIVLNVKDAILAGAKAFEDGRLSAQQPYDPKTLGCYYRNLAGHPCIIGAAISDELWEEHIKDKIDGVPRNVQQITSLLCYGTIQLDLEGLPEGTEIGQAIRVLQNLQEAHDLASFGDAWRRKALLQRLEKLITMAAAWAQGEGEFPLYGVW